MAARTFLAGIPWRRRVGQAIGLIYGLLWSLFIVGFVLGPRLRPWRRTAREMPTSDRF